METIFFFRLWIQRGQVCTPERRRTAEGGGGGGGVCSASACEESQLYVMESGRERDGQLTYFYCLFFGTLGMGIPIKHLETEEEGGERRGVREREAEREGRREGGE